MESGNRKFALRRTAPLFQENTQWNWSREQCPSSEGSQSSPALPQPGSSELHLQQPHRDFPPLRRRSHSRKIIKSLQQTCIV